MVQLDRKKHWENIYQTKQTKEVSWFQDKPETSLQFIESFNLPKSAKIIDIGGGDSLLVDNLLNLGFQDITILDISEAALEKAKRRLSAQAEKIKWIVSDVASFKPTEKYDLWHDRAAFHFLTQEHDISNYVKTVEQSLQPKGFLLLGTFSDQGPEKCSGLDVKQYSELSMNEIFNKSFNKESCLKVDHQTPSGSVQNFIFCVFRRK